jgi:DmsE family decaheme c-type cytochrome
MSGPRRRVFLGVIGALVLAVSWSVSGAKSPRKPVDWVALHPAFEGATFVDDPETCRLCHDDTMRTYTHTKHARAFGLDTASAARQCETCHGPRSKHVEDPGVSLAFERGSREQAAVCLQCHQGGSRMGWQAGVHQSHEVGCSDCHAVMEQRSQRALLVRPSATETCYSCHGDVRADMNKMSHHPVREGRMECASCHNVHGTTPALLTRNTLNETCYTCHAEKRGPFIWEHAPARESCANCHTPHGANQRNLLTSKDPFLCLSCHSYGGHINLPRYNRVSNPYGSGCSNCHVSAHGSNHPSGAKLTR